MNGFEYIAFLHLYNQFIVAVVMVTLFLNKNTRTAGSGFWTMNIILYCVGTVLNLVLRQTPNDGPILISRLPILIGSSFFALGFNTYFEKPIKNKYFYFYIITISIVFLIGIPGYSNISHIIFALHSLIITATYLWLFKKGSHTGTSGIYYILRILFVMYSVYIVVCFVNLIALIFGFNDYIRIYYSLITVGILTAVNYAVIVMISIDRLFYQVQNAQTRKEEMIIYKQLSEIDALTGLYNRRTVELRAEELLKNAKCTKSVFSIFMIDINSFKMINDVNGHDIGDKVLFGIAESLTSKMRKSDLVGRWGGDEFVILSPGTNEQEANEVNERLIEMVFSINIENEHRDIPVRISSGFGTYRQDDSLSMIIKRADIMLYDIKSQYKQIKSNSDSL